MFKEFIDFMMTGFILVVGYIAYFVAAVISTILIGAPIGIGVYMIQQFVHHLFNGA